MEAKKLGEPLASHRMQMLNYANASGIAYAGLTDGNHWELYNIFQQGLLEDRRILDVSIADTPAYESALKLLLLWRPNLASGQQPVPASAPLVGDVRRPAPIPDDVNPPTTALPGWVALSEWSAPAGTQCPAAIRFWDRSERTLSYWYEILTFVVEKLHSEGRLTVKDAPIQWSKKTYSVHTEPVHPTGTPFKSYKNIDGIGGTPLFVNVHLNAGQIRQITKNLLLRYDRNPAEVSLQVAQ